MPRDIFGSIPRQAIIDGINKSAELGREIEITIGEI